MELFVDEADAEKIGRPKDLVLGQRCSRLRPKLGLTLSMMSALMSVDRPSNVSLTLVWLDISFAAMIEKSIANAVW